jgi:TfoX/Sxy family transcriptional regulator of competence genes
MAVSELLADRVRTLLTGEPGLSERKMFGGFCFMINGNMACGITGKNDLMLRVGPEAYEKALAHPDARPMDFTGRPMKGMVFVDPDVCPDAEAMAAWLERALTFARSLPAK